MTIRRVTDDDGIEWQVYEVVLPDQLRRAEGTRRPLNLPSAWLCFENATQRRRLSPVPDGWQQAPSAELRRLLDAALKLATHRASRRARVASILGGHE